MNNRPTSRSLNSNFHNYIVLAGILTLLLIATLIINSCISTKNDSNQTNTTQSSVADQGTKVSLLLAGDAVIHESVYKDAEISDGSYDFSKQLDEVTSVAHDFDLAFYNQESILGGSNLGLSGYPTFNAPQEFGAYMAGQGFNLISTANNHSLDRGLAGIQASREFWNSQTGIFTDGTNSTQAEQEQIPTVEKNGIQIAFVAYCENTNGITADYNWEVNYSSTGEEKMLSRIKQAKSASDVVIVSIHWGDEYSPNVNARQTSLAEKIVDAGGDIIVGNHPHVVQPFQMMDGKPVFYAMGNLISSQVDQENLVGMTAAIDIHKSVDGTVTFDNLRADLTYTEMDGCYPELRSNIKVKLLKNVSDEVMTSQECNKTTNSAHELYDATIERVKSLDSNIQIGGIWD